MTALARRVLASVRRRELFDRRDRVAVALSGGADSVALTALLSEIAAERGCALAGVIHVNHTLRGEESEADERFCRDLAHRYRIPIDVTRVDVRSRARESHTSLEAAARELRYEAFQAAAGRLGATLVATAHTADDQAETLLLRLLRGAGLRGLSGIRPRRGIVVRPLLDVSRADLRRYLSKRQMPFREDSSNADVSIARNRIRHELLPVIAGIAPGGVRALARLADLARDEDELMEAQANLHAPAASKILVVTTLQSLPAALARRLIQRAAAAASPRTPLSARHVDAVRRLAASDKPMGRLDLPRLLVVRDHDILTFGSAQSRTASVNRGRRARRRLTPRA